MSIDLSQFHQVFFEESFEGLDIMENGLMILTPGSDDSEEINTIFRAAHSIKGGAGTFGFQMVSDFTHVAETLLDEYRSGQRTVTQDGIELLLESVDVLRNILGDLQNNADVDMSDADTLKTKFEVLLASTVGVGTDATADDVIAGVSAGSNATEEPTDATIPSEEDSSLGDSDEPVERSGFWRIKFIPSTDIVQTGNEPFRLIRELKELGDTDVSISLDNIPEFSVLDPELLYFSWTIDVHSDCEKESISEIFEWVVDDSTVEIVRIESVM